MIPFIWHTERQNYKNSYQVSGFTASMEVGNWTKKGYKKSYNDENILYLNYGGGYTILFFSQSRIFKKIILLCMNNTLCGPNFKEHIICYIQPLWEKPN